MRPLGEDSSPAIEVRGLRKLYGQTVALHDIDFDVRRGEIFAVLGPNGAGKTTTVEILEGFRPRDGGTVKVLGQDPFRAGEDWRARIGVVLQTTGEFEDLNVGEVVRHFARYYPDAQDPDALIDRVGLTEKRAARASKLSGGQQRRLDVALGIIGRPDVLFLDEPTTGFDPASRRDFWQLIRDLAAGGTTIVLTTHYLEEAEQLADRVAVIVGGRIVDIGVPQTLGGRDTEATVVSWLGPDGPRTVHTTTPTKFAADLHASLGGEAPGLTVHRPSLEDVYLQMIGAAATPTAVTTEDR
ncbi:ABC transporter ATP-binding protein [Dactylosporangium aurantiacum]|uniref:ABC transporter ATP-binding protein n=1 Tax=Dactylosporangium aurantiacum TaxID=35754 RepID=A0A9Q9MCJ8_9ACTN|nr:ABC transporter ATP-binding protein [Dactylosporangium aurantiacum]MDG6106876.1 ABC transporter ATP-binding protein [Dactylosporangium aurantiacum]UWZ51009.1 ABC transporter ATP-binding protein [Dactylosporangium aurantiacum]